MRITLSILFIVALASCAYQPTNATSSAYEQSRHFINRPITEFIDATGLAPSSDVKTSQGKTFFFVKQETRFVPGYTPVASGYYNDPLMAAAAHNIASTYAEPSRYETIECRVSVKTRKSGKLEGLDNYIITEIGLYGQC